MSRTAHRTAAATLLLILFAAAPAFAGPPWIAVEYPANPFTAATRGALLLIRTYHHGDAVNYPLSGTAEGLVDGKRRSIPLEFTPTGITGEYALRFARPSTGVWVLVASLGTGKERIGALIGLDSAGRVASVEVPTHMQDRWVIPEAVSPAAVEAALQARTAAVNGSSGVTVGLGGGTGLALLAGLGVLVALPLRRRQRGARATARD